MGSLLQKNSNRLFYLIFFIALFLRAYKLSDNFSFGDENALSLLVVKDAIVNKTIPLVGPATSHAWLNFPPLFHWILIPVTLMFRFEPIVLSYVGIFFGLLSVVLNYVVISKVVNKKVALISSYLMAISPYYIQFSRSGRFMFSLIPLVYLVIYYLYKLTKGKEITNVFWIGIFLGLMLSFHFTPLVLIPVVFYFLYTSKMLSLRSVKHFTIGLVIPLLPLAVYDYKNGFKMITNFIIWIPYRFAAFFGIYQKEEIKPGEITGTIKSIIGFLSTTLVQGNYLIQIVLAIIVVTFFILNVKKNNFAWKYIKYSILFAFIAFVVHTNPPSHYFIPIVMIPILVLSIYIYEAGNKKFGRIISFLIITVVSVVNFNYLFFDQYYVEKEDLLYYKDTRIVSEFIVRNAETKSFAISRVGVSDQFEKNAANHYQYILWTLGNEPVVVGDVVIDDSVEPEFEYTIYEDKERTPKTAAVIFKGSNVTVTKKEL